MHKDEKARRAYMRAWRWKKDPLKTVTAKHYGKRPTFTVVREVTDPMKQWITQERIDQEHRNAAEANRTKA